MHEGKNQRTLLKTLRGFFSFFSKPLCGRKTQDGIIKQGKAMRVVLFYEGEEGTYIENACVTLYQSGVIHLSCDEEETSTHLQNCEIIWSFQQKSDNPSGKVRLLTLKKPPPPETP